MYTLIFTLVFLSTFWAGRAFQPSISHSSCLKREWLPQRCCWKKNQTKYNYYLAGCICNYSLVNMSFGELAHNHNDQCPAWVAARVQGCCLSLGLLAAWTGAQAQGSAGQRHGDYRATFQQLEYQHCSPGWCQAGTVNDNQLPVFSEKELPLSVLCLVFSSLRLKCENAQSVILP